MSEQQNNFLPIIHTWPGYFENYDEGLGTTYERFILHNLFAQIMNDFEISNVLEAPGFGMTGISGINSLWWAKQGLDVTLVDDDESRLEKINKVWQELSLSAELVNTEEYHILPFADNSYDLSWNFAALWFVNDMSAFFDELNRVTKKIIFICVPNHYGLGYRLRSMLTKQIIPGFYPDNILPKNILSLASKAGWELINRGYFDIPLWPDIPMKKEDLLNKLGLGFLVNKQSDQNDGSRVTIVDYFNGSEPEMEKNILKYSLLEKAPTPIKQLWGHHRFFIFKKPDVK